MSKNDEQAARQLAQSNAPTIDLSDDLRGSDALPNPTPSKEPSIDDLLLTLEGSILNASLSIMKGGELEASKSASKLAKREAKSQLLALHLGCLPEKQYGKIFKPNGMNPMECRTPEEAWNACQNLMEQKLREMYE